MMFFMVKATSFFKLFASHPILHTLLNTTVLLYLNVVLDRLSQPQNPRPSTLLGEGIHTPLLVIVQLLGRHAATSDYLTSSESSREPVRKLLNQVAKQYQISAKQSETSMEDSLPIQLDFYLIRAVNGWEPDWQRTGLPPLDSLGDVLRRASRLPDSSQRLETLKGTNIFAGSLLPGTGHVVCIVCARYHERKSNKPDALDTGRIFEEEDPIYDLFRNCSYSVDCQTKGEPFHG